MPNWSKYPDRGYYRGRTRHGKQAFLLWPNDFRTFNNESGLAQNALKILFRCTFKPEIGLKFGGFNLKF